MLLGRLSAKYESNGDPGAVSDGWGDAGGISYGCYQLATNAGSVHSFLRWLNKQGHSYADALGQYEPGSEDFTTEWQSIAAIDPGGFEQLQHDYIKYAYYDPAVELLASAWFHVENHHEIMKDVIWSRAVQYGTGYIVEMFETACNIMGYPNLSYIDHISFDKQLIKTIYLDVCRTPEWTSGSPSLREGLYARFENECNDAIMILEGEC